MWLLVTTAVREAKYPAHVIPYMPAPMHRTQTTPTTTEEPPTGPRDSATEGEAATGQAPPPATETKAAPHAHAYAHPPDTGT